MGPSILVCPSCLSRVETTMRLLELLNCAHFFQLGEKYNVWLAQERGVMTINSKLQRRMHFIHQMNRYTQSSQIIFKSAKVSDCYLVIYGKWLARSYASGLRRVQNPFALQLNHSRNTITFCQPRCYTKGKNELLSRRATKACVVKPGMGILLESQSKSFGC